MEKLNMQAILSASAMQDEYVKELLILHQKVRKKKPSSTQVEVDF